MSALNHHANTLDFTCPECQVSMTCTFRADFSPPDHPDFVFCCLGCRQPYRITSWSPVWIVKELPPDEIAAVAARLRRAE